MFGKAVRERVSEGDLPEAECLGTASSSSLSRSIRTRGLSAKRCLRPLKQPRAIDGNNTVNLESLSARLRCFGLSSTRESVSICLRFGGGWVAIENPAQGHTVVDRAH